MTEQPSDPAVAGAKSRGIGRWRLTRFMSRHPWWTALVVFLVTGAVTFNTAADPALLNDVAVAESKKKEAEDAQEEAEDARDAALEELAVVREDLDEARDEPAVAEDTEPEPSEPSDADLAVMEELVRQLEDGGGVPPPAATGDCLILGTGAKLCGEDARAWCLAVDESLKDQSAREACLDFY